MFWYPNENDMGVTDENGITLREFLRDYDPARYERPAVTVDILVFKKIENRLQILLIRRGRHPSIGMLALPGGFLEMDESLEDAAARELYEETGLTGLKLTQLGAYGGVGRDPRLRIVSVAYMTRLEAEVQCRAGDDAADAGFFDLMEQNSAENSLIIHQIDVCGSMGKASSTVVESGGKREITHSSIASDHSLMILDALEKLEKLAFTDKK